ncbi:MAG: ABC transporter ATP-binding protein [Pelagimonas sp.]|jgi:putative hydroxymethylpyrimidine transport system ATP-binding protein|nr:ABC transporter ATP-binding protein [Pelagimonas sp.]
MSLSPTTTASSPRPPGITVQGGATINGTPLFAPLTLTLGAGRWTCLLGGSGVGKSTVLRLICGLSTGAQFEGTITASDGQDVPSRVAYMAQDDLLLPWASVAQNVGLGAKLRGGRTDPHRLSDILSRVGLAEHADKTPNELSGGQRQRVALARTLMEDKPIILLDEPFSALDAQTRAMMQDLAVELLAGKTVLIVTHDPAEAARLGQAILVMTADGVSDCATPALPLPRPVDALETLQCQAALLQRLRGDAA